MKSFSIFFLIPVLLMIVSIGNQGHAQQLDDYEYTGDENLLDNTVESEIQFNGYTNYWHDTYRNWYRYGNLFKMSVPNVEKTLAQSRFDISEELGLPGLTLQEGFFNGLMASAYELLDQPSMDELGSAIQKGNVLVLTDPASEAGKKLLGKSPGNDPWRNKLKSYQFEDPNLVDVQAFYLDKGERRSL